MYELIVKHEHICKKSMNRILSELYVLILLIYSHNLSEVINDGALETY